MLIACRPKMIFLCIKSITIAEKSHCPFGSSNIAIAEQLTLQIRTFCAVCQRSSNVFSQRTNQADKRKVPSVEWIISNFEMNLWSCFIKGMVINSALMQALYLSVACQYENEGIWTVIFLLFVLWRGLCWNDAFH